MQKKKRYQVMVQRLEVQAHAQPRLYRFKLAILALLGYAVVLLALLLTVGLAIVLTVKVAMQWDQVNKPYAVIAIIILSNLGLWIGQALWVRFTMPKGYVLSLGQAPVLRQIVEQVRQAMNAPKLDGVIINDAFNAAAAYVPSGIGGLGRQRYYLVLGLPLLQTLDEPQMRAIIGHEFGHFSQKETVLESWVYRLRITYERLVGTLSGHMGVFLGLFFCWYARFFDAYSLVLMREHEYRADSAGACVTSAEAMGGALLRLERVDDWQRQWFWPQLVASARKMGHPPGDVHQQWLEQLPSSDVRWWLSYQKPEADVEDTHPALAQRLQALNVDEQGFVGQQAAVAGYWLGGALLDELLQGFNQRWKAEVQEIWQQTHQQGQKEQYQLSLLSQKHDRSPSEAWGYAQLVERYWPGEDALVLYEQALAQLPDHAGGRANMGLLLLKGGQWQAAMLHLREAVRLDEMAIEPVLMGLWQHGQSLYAQDAAVASWVEELQGRFKQLQLLADVQELTDFSAHSLDAAQLQRLQEVLRGYEKVKAAWVVDQPQHGIEQQAIQVVLLQWAGSVVSETVGLKQLNEQLRWLGGVRLLTGTGEAEKARAIKQVAEVPFYQQK